MIGAELSLPLAYALIISGLAFAADMLIRRLRAHRAGRARPTPPAVLFDWRVSCPELRQPTHVHRRVS